MIKPDDIEPGAWEMICAAERGDAAALRRLLERDPGLARTGYWYAGPLHFAARQGHVEGVRVLLDAGADPGPALLIGEDLAAMARERGYDEVALSIEEARAARGRTVPAAAPVDHAIHSAAAAGDVEAVRRLLDTDPQLVHLGDSQGAAPLHRAAAESAREVIFLLLDRGADIHALHGAGPGNAAGYASVDHQAIDMALWEARDLETAQLLIGHGADHDLAISAALGEVERVTSLLDSDPARIREARPCGRRALSAAVEFGHGTIVRLLLERGADPSWPEGAEAPRGRALHTAARAGDRGLVELLLAHGADPNSSIESSGNATYAARTRELRALLMERGGRLDPYDLIWLDEDDEAVRRVTEDPASANAGCGGVFTAAATLGKCDLVVRLLAAGARVPPALTACRSYLMEDPEILRLLLESGMNPDLPNWQMATPLHDLCGRDGRGRPHARRLECAPILIDAGANMDARDDEYRSTPLAWAARSDLPDMVELLLGRGAPTRLPDDPPWATPLAWATRRGHRRVIELLQAAGATA